jgi:ADP-ribosylglycohydrolase
MRGNLSMLATLEQRFIGCLVGQCLGDALGFPVEGRTPIACRQYVQEILRTGRAGENGRRGFPFGQYTDDSQLARELLQSYLACNGRFDPRDYAHRISDIFSENRIVGCGAATEDAAWRLAQGVPWDEAGAPPPAAGNGSAMRAGPIGLLLFDDRARLVDAAHDQGRITHKDSRCSGGAVAIASAVAVALQGRPISGREFLADIARSVEMVDQSVAGACRNLVEWLSLPPEEAVIPISKAGVNQDRRPDWQGISPFVTSSVLWSLYCFLRSPDDYWETICVAIAVGGDVDTTAAMAGAISGTYLGIDALPLDLANRLTDRGTWGYGELSELAVRCCRLKISNGSITGPAATNDGRHSLGTQ